MVNKTRCIPLLLFLLTLFSCTSREEREFSALLDRADSLMRTRPDSSLYILNKVETPSTTSLSMRHALLRADALNKCDSVLPSDTLLRELADYYDRHGSANERMRAHYLLGRCYHDMGEAPRALECYQHAAEQADTTSKDCDLYTLYAVYGQMADLYHFENLPTNEIKALASCEKVAWKSKDTLTALRCRELQIRPYYLLGDTTKVLQIVSYMNRIYKENGNEDFAVSAYPVSIFIYIKRGNYAKAREQMNAYEAQSGFFDKTKNINRGREHYYYSKGLYYMGVHRIDSAEYYFRKVGQAEFQKECYKGLLEVYRYHAQIDSVLKYSKLYEAALDTLHNQMSTETVGNISSLYNYQRNQRIAQELTISNRNLLVIIVSVCFLLVVTILLLIIHSQRSRIREEQLQLRIHQLLSEINRKEPEQEATEEVNIKDTPIYQTINRKLSREDDSIMKDSEWNELATMLNDNCQGFTRKLKELHPMNESELRVSMLLKVGCSPKQIAELCCITISGVSNIRSRLVEKVMHLSAVPKAWDQFIQKL